MDCLMVFDVNNYLLYVKHNLDFLEALSSLVFDCKLTDLDSPRNIKEMFLKDDKQLENMIVLLFAPYVASIRVLGSESPSLDVFADKYPSVKIIYSQFLDYIFLYIADSTNFTHEKKMEHNLTTFVAISKLMFGVALSEIKGDENQMKLLTSIYNNWLKNSTCPVYMVEATEKLFISQSVQKIFSDLVRSNIMKLSSHLDRFSVEIPSHGLLFVERKLITRTSSRNAVKLNKGDLVLLTLLADTLQGTREYYSEKEDTLKISFDDFDEDGIGDKTNQNEKDYETNERRTFTESYESSSSSSESSPIKGEKRNYRWKEFDHRLIFLHSSIDQRYLVPFYSRFIRISKEISFIILSQLPTTLITFHIHNLLRILNILQYRPKDLRRFHSLQEFDASLTKLNRHLAENSQKSDLIRTLISKLNQLSKSEIRKHILSRNNEEVSAQLDSLASSVSAILKTVYCEKVFLHHQRLIERFIMDPTMSEFMFSLQNNCFNVFKDYIDYFHVKSQRNMALEAYSDVVPGLVGFIYVDRNLNELIMAKVDDGADAIGDFNLLNLNLSKNVLPQLVETAYFNLSNGQFTSTWSGNGLSFNYIIWFETENGEILKIPKERSEMTGYPSMMNGNFVDKMLASYFPSYRLGLSPTKGGNLLCFELFYVQKLSYFKPGRQIIEARKLARRLWAVTSSSIRVLSIF
ncbi:Hermansky-Pudlak syndrome 1 protein homolog [Tetranychus urticae]|uniref:Hermansky-Pudlak syndrome 1 protein homolog n=1 Tax=Tetranychus urticae TaxID=32264 RepID=UPI00077BF4A3|nr:Hermansky-Pudlak syndrome 1 protein homolog [Tetranychus urticae]